MLTIIVKHYFCSLFGIFADLAGAPFLECSWGKKEGGPKPAVGCFQFLLFKATPAVYEVKSLPLARVKARHKNRHTGFVWIHLAKLCVIKLDTVPSVIMLDYGIA